MGNHHDILGCVLYRSAMPFHVPSKRGLFTALDYLRLEKNLTMSLAEFYIGSDLFYEQVFERGFHSFIGVFFSLFVFKVAYMDFSKFMLKLFQYCQPI